MYEAEDHTARYYCFPPHRWQSLRFDLLTRQDREFEPVHTSVVARLQRLSRPGTPLRQSFDFFRIQLNDPTILDVLRRPDFRAELYPFLVYILTHELVHLVRLSSILGEEKVTRDARDAEETRVERISRQILYSSPHLAVEPIISKFGLRHCIAE